jgi:cell division protein FtsB
MDRPTEAPAAEADSPTRPPAVDPDRTADAAAALSLDGLTVAGITRRRVAWLLAAFVSLWLVVIFARQVGEASAATAQADEMALANEQLATDVDALGRELDLIQRQDFVEQQARGEGLGRGREVPFRLAADAPPLPADAPGSAAVRLGMERTQRTPLESWLSILFGPAN